MFNMGDDTNSYNDHTTEFSVPVFNEIENNDMATITVQPYSNNDYPGTRRPIPISTIDWQSTNSLQMVPQQGIDFLRGAEQVYIQQTVELNDLLNVVSENRYKISVPHGETLFYATESSNDIQRMCCGSNRGFLMCLYDQTQQEALYFKRTVTCGCCSFWCKRQNLEVWLPNERYIGGIKQQFSLSVPSFLINNNHGTIIYRIEGPASCGVASKEAHFKIYSVDGLTQLGSINHLWDQVQNEYNINIQFPNRRDDSKHKALLIGAAFLLEYMYFFHAKKSGSCLWC